MKYVIGVLLLFSPFKYEIQAQAVPVDVPTMLPVSPTAASLGSYGEIPISLYTGLADISIPIGEMKGTEISVPLSLNYRSSGITVESNASWVGSGWDLSAGGVITRTQRHNPDKYCENGHMVPHRPSLPLSTNFTQKFDAIIDAGLIAGVDDMEPDVFNYNFGGKSGTFVFDEQGNARFNQFDDLKIKFEKVVISTYPYYSSRFDIITSNGTEYIFDVIERSTANEEPTSWYLSKIISSSGQEVFNFLYESEDYAYQPADRVILSASPGYGITTSPLDNTRVEMIGKRLKEINSNTAGKIIFVPNTVKRIDLWNISELTPAYALKDILLYNANNELYKKVRLETENVETFLRYHNTTPLLGNEYFNWRLYLKKVTVLDPTETVSEPPYIFTYERTAEGKDKLPHKVSFAQDHWGYYNGKDDNLSLNPPYIGPFGSPFGEFSSPYDPLFDIFPPICQPAASSITVTAFTGDRTPSFPFMQAGALRQIQYPTGGRSEFEYEPHHGVFEDELLTLTYTGIVGGLRIKSITNFDNCNNIIGKKEYEYSEGRLTNFPAYRSYEYYNEGYGGIFQQCAHYTEGYDGHLIMRIGNQSYRNKGITKGSNVGYFNVTELVKGKGSSLYDYSAPTLGYADENANQTRYIFYSNQTEVRDEKVVAKYSHAGWPYHPMKNNDWKRGLLFGKTIKDEFGKVLSNETYTYGLEELGTVPALCIKTIRAYFDYLYAEYQVPYGWAYLKKKITNHYNEDGTPGLETITDYVYEPTHKYKSLETVSTNDGTKTTTYKYPFNLSEVPYTSMVNRNIIAPVVETKTSRNGSEILVESIIFKDWFNDQKVFSPELIQVKRGIAGVNETRIRYHTLDNYGKVLSVSKENGFVTSYIWDDFHVTPIAEVKNASFSDIAYTSFETGSHGNWSYGSNVVNSAISFTGSRHYNLSASNTLSKSGLSPSVVYIVRYWSRNGAFNVSSSTGQSVGMERGWTCYVHEITGVSGVDISGVGAIDEVSISPKTSLMSTMGSKPSVGIAFSGDNKGQYINYEYDLLNRLKIIRDQSNNVLKKFSYNYDANVTACNQQVYYNEEKSHIYINTKCTVGHGLEVEYKVSAKTFSSTISVEDANSKAQALLDKYGQSRADKSGACDPYYHSARVYRYFSPIVPCPIGFYPYQVYVDVPFDQFKSEVSQEDADNQAVEYAQQYANQHACVAAVNITASNINVIPNFKVKFFNISTNTEYEFDISILGGVVGQVPPGNYTVTFINPYNLINYTFEAAGYSMIGTEAEFYNILIDQANSNISIY